MADIASGAVSGVFDLFDDDDDFTNVYSKHNEADLDLPGITVGLESMVPRGDDSYTIAGALGVPWDVSVSVRVHIAYVGGVIDQAVLIGLVDDVIEKLRSNYQTIAGYMLTDVSVEFGRTFDESETVGAQVTAVYLARDEYEQEA
jgi:hypothetical protein